MHELKVATVELTSSQILNLHTTPVEIVPAQGPGNVIVPVSVLAEMEFGTTAYAAGDTINLQYSGQSYGSAPNVAIANPNLTRVTGSSFSLATPTFTSNSGIFLNSVGKNVGLSALADNAFTSGDGKLVVTVWYVVGNLV